MATDNESTNNETESTQRERVCPVNVYKKGLIKPFIIGNGFITVWPTFTVETAKEQTAEDILSERFAGKVDALKTAGAYDAILEMIKGEIAARKNSGSNKLPESINGDDLRAFPAVRIYSALGRYDLSVMAVNSVSQDDTETLTEFAELIIRRMNGKVASSDFAVMWKIETLEAMIKIAGCAKLTAVEMSQDDKKARDKARKEKADKMIADCGFTADQLKIDAIKKIVTDASREGESGQAFTVEGKWDNDKLWAEVIKANPRTAGAKEPANQQ